MLINDLVDSLKNVLENFCDIESDNKTAHKNVLYLKDYSDDQISIASKGRIVMFKLKQNTITEKPKADKSIEQILADGTEIADENTFIIKGKVDEREENSPIETLSIKNPKGTIEIFYPGIGKFNSGDTVEIWIRRL